MEQVNIKPYYHTFEFKNRTITLCLVWIEHVVRIGYSVKLPEDYINEDLAKKIALGRTKKNFLRNPDRFPNWLVLSSNNLVNKDIKNDKGILKAIAKNCERCIINDRVVIKGIR